MDSSSMVPVPYRGYLESLGSELNGEVLVLLGDEVEVDVAAGASQLLGHAHQLQTIIFSSQYGTVPYR